MLKNTLLTTTALLSLSLCAQPAFAAEKTFNEVMFNAPPVMKGHGYYYSKVTLQCGAVNNTITPGVYASRGAGNILDTSKSGLQSCELTGVKKDMVPPGVNEQAEAVASFSASYDKSTGLATLHSLKHELRQCDSSGLCDMRDGAGTLEFDLRYITLKLGQVVPCICN